MTHASYALGDQISATVGPTPTRADLLTIEQGLVGHALESGIEARNHVPLAVVLRHAEQGTVGGLVGTTVWGWLQVEQLWIDDAFRRRGLGGKLLLLAETEAARRGCHHARLDTFDFQSLGFYEKRGYEVFGRLNDFPTGHVRFFVAKQLAT